MNDRHTRQPISFRPAADDYDWLERHAEETGKPVRRILAEALSEYRRLIGERDGRTGSVQP